MKNYRFSLLGLALLVLVVSCRKEDLRSKGGTNTQTSPVTSAIKTSGWNSLSNWSASKADEVTTYFSAIADSSVSTDVAKAGLVLVYSKSGNNIQLLPFQDKATGAYWYYQVSKGSIRINSYNSQEQNLNEQSFSYFIITPQQLSDLETKGKTKLDLLELSYEQALALSR